MLKGPDARKQSQGFVELRKKTVVELNELLERQRALLRNTQFIRKLPDKGVKINQFKLQIVEELKKRTDISETVDLMSRVAISENIDGVEWGSECSHTNGRKTDKDSDDDSDVEVDPLKLLATHCGTQKSKITKEHRTDASLVTEKDIEEVRTFSSVPYGQEYCRRIDGIREPPERFKPNQPKSKEGVKSAFRSSSENVQKSLGKHWEVTAATPPIPVHGDTKKISLADSLDLQRDHAQKLKEIQYKMAISKLQQTIGISMGPLPTKDLMKYRTPVDPGRVFEGTERCERHEEEGVFDEEDQGGMNAVFYNIVDDVEPDDK